MFHADAHLSKLPTTISEPPNSSISLLLLVLLEMGSALGSFYKGCSPLLYLLFVCSSIEDLMSSGCKNLEDKGTIGRQWLAPPNACHCPIPITFPLLSFILDPGQYFMAHIRAWKISENDNTLMYMHQFAAKIKLVQTTLK